MNQSLPLTFNLILVLEFPCVYILSVRSYSNSANFRNFDQGGVGSKYFQLDVKHPSIIHLELFSKHYEKSLSK